MRLRRRPDRQVARLQGAGHRHALSAARLGRNRVDEKAVAANVGEKLERPDAQFVRDVTGYAIGGIPPFGHAERLETYIDEALLAHDLVWAAAGTPNALFSVSPAALAEVTGAAVIAVTQQPRARP